MDDVFYCVLDTNRCWHSRIANTKIKNIFFTDDFTLCLSIGKKFTNNRTLRTQTIHFL